MKIPVIYVRKDNPISMLGQIQMTSMTMLVISGSITSLNICLAQESMFIITVLCSFCLSTLLQSGILFLQKMKDFYFAVGQDIFNVGSGYFAHF